jgi:SUMO ligase MMS21 Smc5/6 complex component
MNQTIETLSNQYKNFIEEHDYNFKHGADNQYLINLEKEMDSKLIQYGYNPSEIHELITEYESKNQTITQGVIENILYLNKNE